MANTIIQIKRSTITTQPVSLTSGEPAYSYLSDKLFIGDASGNVIEVGGRFYINAAAQSWNTANAAFIAANAAFAKANTVAGDADEKANAALVTANVAFDAANAAFAQANSTSFAGTIFDVANAAFGTANIAISNVNYVNTATKAAYDFANTVYSNYAYPAYVAVGPAFDKANAANVLAYNTGIGANAYASGVGSNANLYAASVGTSANAYADATFVKLTAASQTITGDLSVTGNLNILGNSTLITTETLQVTDPLIYLAGNNYISDLVDIGFIANYVNATGANVHTGLYREHENKMYYLFQGYDAEPANNHIGAMSNNMTLAVLNADIITSNLRLNGVNAFTFIQNAYAQANTVGTQANAYADIVGTSANAFATSATIAANNYAGVMANAANAYMISTISGANTAVGAGANAYAAAVGTSANAYASAVGVAANSYASAVGVAANTYASAVGVGANTYADGVGSAANTNAANASYLSTGTVPSGRLTGSYTGITGLGTITVGTWNADTINVAYGGTGITSVANNGLLFGRGGSGALRVVSSSTEGHVLQTNEHGTPVFAMLDGGAF